jgi:hypothetical protein
MGRKDVVLHVYMLGRLRFWINENRPFEKRGRIIFSI